MSEDVTTLVGNGRLWGIQTWSYVCNGDKRYPKMVAPWLV